MGKRILLLEKERNLAHFLSLELQKEQYRVDQVEEGQKALSMALQTDYDLILLKCSSRGYDSPGFCRTVESD